MSIAKAAFVKADAAIPATEKGAAGGVAALDGDAAYAGEFASPPPLAAGGGRNAVTWYGSPAGIDGTGLDALGLMCLPFYVAKARAIHSIGVFVISAGAAGAVARLGVYANDASDRPGALIADAGLVTVDTTGEKIIAFGAQPSVGPGLVHLAVAVQSPGALPGFRLLSRTMRHTYGAYSAESESAGTYLGWHSGDYSAGLPDPHPGITSSPHRTPHIAVRFA